MTFEERRVELLRTLRHWQEQEAEAWSLGDAYGEDVARHWQVNIERALRMLAKQEASSR